MVFALRIACQTRVSSFMSRLFIVLLFVAYVYFNVLLIPVHYMAYLNVYWCLPVFTILLFCGSPTELVSSFIKCVCFYVLLLLMCGSSAKLVCIVWFQVLLMFLCCCDPPTFFRLATRTKGSNAEGSP